jgi:hypothetical protein
MMVESGSIRASRYKGQEKRLRLVAGRDEALTTQCRFRPHFSAIQPPSELIPRYPRPWKIESTSIILCTSRQFYRPGSSVHTARSSETRYSSQLQAHTILRSDTQDGTDESSQAYTFDTALEGHTLPRTRQRLKNTHHALPHPSARTMRSNNLRPPAPRPPTFPLRHTHIDLRLLPTRYRGDPARAKTHAATSPTTPQPLPPTKRRHLPVKLQQLREHRRARSLLLT